MGLISKKRRDKIKEWVFWEAPATLLISPAYISAAAKWKVAHNCTKYWNSDPDKQIRPKQGPKFWERFLVKTTHRVCFFVSGILLWGLLVLYTLAVIFLIIICLPVIILYLLMEGCKLLIDVTDMCLSIGDD